ncbi:tetratricopeptide repeat protein [Streptomyces venezuelae]|nr:tetratricopeptide repeat protein [Streptomyces venezuelae]
MTGDLIFGILPRQWALVGWVAAALLVGAVTYTVQRVLSTSTEPAAGGGRLLIDQLKPEPVLIGRAHLARELLRAVEGGAPAAGPADGSPPAARGRAHVVVVHGPAGTGKTTLAMYAAHQVRDRFPDGLLYIDLQGDADSPVSSASALEHLLRSLGVASSEIPRTTGDRAALFRQLASPLRLLLLLDNAYSTEQVEPLVPAAPGCTVLVTSRRALTVGDVSRLRSVRMVLPEEDDALALLTHWSGRARIDQDPASALEIVRFCGRLPLALKIVGARLSSRTDMTLARMRDRLENENSRLQELAFDSVSLQACLMLSYRDLPEQARLLLGALARLPKGHLTDWHAELVTADPSAVDELTATCLLDTEGGADSGAPAQYRLHDLVRVFAADRFAALTPEQRDGSDARLVAGYREAAAALAALRAPELAEYASAPPAAAWNGLSAADWFTTEADRLVWVRERAAALGLPEAGALVAECAAYFADDLAATPERAAQLFAADGAQNGAPPAAAGPAAAGPAAEGPAAAGPAAARTAARRQEAARARAHAYLCLAKHDFAGALTALGTGDVPHEPQEPYAAARHLALRARVARERGDFPTAFADMSAAVEALRSLGDSWHLGMALEMLGEIRRIQAFPWEGESFQRESLQIAEEFGDLRARARLQRTLGETLTYQRNFAEAGQLLEAATAAFRSLGDRVWEARSLAAAGKVQRITGDRAAALQSLELALSVFEQFDQPFWAGRVHHSLIRVFGPAGEMQRAYEAAHRALELFESTGHTLWHSYVIRDLGWLHLRSGRIAEAYEPLEVAAEESRAAGDVFAEAMARNVLGVAYRDGGRHGDARRELETALAIYRRAGHGWYQAVCTRDLVTALRAAGRPAEADRLAREATAANPLFPGTAGRDGAVAVPDED